MLYLFLLYLCCCVSYRHKIVNSCMADAQFLILTHFIDQHDSREHLARSSTNVLFKSEYKHIIKWTTTLLSCRAEALLSSNKPLAPLRAEMADTGYNFTFIMIHTPVHYLLFWRFAQERWEWECTAISLEAIFRYESLMTTFFRRMGHVAADEVGSLKDNSDGWKWSPQSADAVNRQ